MASKLSKNLRDILSRQDIEWQEFVLENPVQTADYMRELFEYAMEMEGRVLPESKIETPKDLYNLGFHELGDMPNWTYVLRVPGGWIYIFNNPPEEGNDLIVFVPFNNEFQILEKDNDK